MIPKTIKNECVELDPNIKNGNKRQEFINW